MKKSCLILLFIFGFFFSPPSVMAYDNFPRLFGGRMEPGSATDQYSRYHILGYGLHKDSQTLNSAIKSRNPSIQIIAYIASQEINQYGESRGLHHDLYNLIEANNWWHWDPWVRSEEGCNKCVCSYFPNNFMACWDESRGRCHSQHWPCTWNIDVTDACPQGWGEWAGYRWNTGLPKFLSEHMFNQPCGNGKDCWDGVFLDNYFYRRDAAWDGGEQTILSSLRANDPDKLSVINSQVYLAGCYGRDTDCREGSPNGVSPYADFASHFLWESFLSNPLRRPNGGWYSRWDSSMRGYVWWMRNSTYKGFVASVSGDKWVGGDGYDFQEELHNYRRMRYGLTSTLMSDGYFAYRPFVLATVWYDEYSVNLETGRTTQETVDPNDFSEGDDEAVGYLGRPLGGARSSVTGRSSGVVALENAVSDPNFGLDGRVWQREFENGLVIVNPTEDQQTVRGLGSGQYRRILGVQDPRHNDGRGIEESLTLEAGDGVILLRVLDPGPSLGAGWNWAGGFEGWASRNIYRFGLGYSSFSGRINGRWSSWVRSYGGNDFTLVPSQAVAVRYLK